MLSPLCPITPHKAATISLPAIQKRFLRFFSWGAWHLPLCSLSDENNVSIYSWVLGFDYNHTQIITENDASIFFVATFWLAQSLLEALLKIKRCSAHEVFSPC